MNLVDSSGWLEYYTGGGNAAFFRPVIETDRNLVVPTVVIYEVFRHVLRTAGEEAALFATGAMQERNVVELSVMIARAAAKFAHEHKLAMADGIILATARQYDATIWTQDADFQSLDKVKFRAKQK